MTIHTRRGRWYDELEVGDIHRHSPGRTISEYDNVMFCGLTNNMQSLHWDAEKSAESEFGQRLVNSLLMLGITAGLSVADLTEGTTIANLGFGEIEFPKPVFAGDTIRSVTTIMELRDSKSRPNAGIVTFKHEGLNQRDELVCSCLRQGLMLRKPAA